MNTMNNTEMVTEFEYYLVNEKRRAKNTLDSYLTDLQQFLTFIGGKPLNHVGPKDIKSFIMKLVVEDKVSATTQNRKIATLRTFYGKFLAREGLIEINPLALVESAEVPESIPQPVSIEDIDKLIEHCPSFREKVMIELMYATGARRFEVAKMEFNDIDFNSKQVMIVGKKGKKRFVPLHDNMIDMLIEWKKLSGDCPYLFPGRSKQAPITVRAINKLIVKIRDSAGLSGKAITPHKLRHSFCSHLYESGADMLTIKDLAGHAKMDTTLVYTKTSTTRNQKEYRQFHPRAQQGDLFGE